MPRPTLTGAGYVLHADAQYNSNVMTGSGRVAPSGRFVSARVRSVTGGTSPQIQIRNGVSGGAPLVRSTAATNGAEIDQRGSPDACPNGIWLEVTGNPTSIDVLVLFR